MTNLEYLTAALHDEIDDGGASMESAAAYHIACPYYAGDKGLPCEGLEYPWDELRVCGPCKLEWLEKEYEG